MNGVEVGSGPRERDGSEAHVLAAGGVERRGAGVARGGGRCRRRSIRIGGLTRLDDKAERRRVKVIACDRLHEQRVLRPGRVEDSRVEPIGVGNRHVREAHVERTLVVVGYREGQHIGRGVAAPGTAEVSGLLDGIRVGACLRERDGPEVDDLVACGGERQARRGLRRCGRDARRTAVRVGGDSRRDHEAEGRGSKALACHRLGDDSLGHGVKGRGGRIAVGDGHHADTRDAQTPRAVTLHRDGDPLVTGVTGPAVGGGRRLTHRVGIGAGPRKREVTEACRLGSRRVKEQRGGTLLWRRRCPRSPVGVRHGARLDLEVELLGAKARPGHVALEEGRGVRIEDGGRRHVGVGNRRRGGHLRGEGSVSAGTDLDGRGLGAVVAGPAKTGLRRLAHLVSVGAHLGECDGAEAHRLAPRRREGRRARLLRGRRRTINRGHREVEGLLGKVRSRDGLGKQRVRRGRGIKRRGREVPVGIAGRCRNARASRGDGRLRPGGVRVLPGRRLDGERTGRTVGDDDHGERTIEVLVDGLRSPWARRRHPLFTHHVGVGSGLGEHDGAEAGRRIGFRVVLSR